MYIIFDVYSKPISIFMIFMYVVDVYMQSPTRTRGKNDL